MGGCIGSGYFGYSVSQNLFPLHLIGHGFHGRRRETVTVLWAWCRVSSLSITSDKISFPPTLQVLRQACRRGYGSSPGPTLLHGPSFETLERFSYTLLCVCVDRLDYSVAHTLLQLTGAYFQVGS